MVVVASNSAKMIVFAIVINIAEHEHKRSNTVKKDESLSESRVFASYDESFLYLSGKK